MPSLIVRGIDYGLSLYFSYLLPLFEITRKRSGISIHKWTGYCRGLVIECHDLVCRIKYPGMCSRGFVEKITGIDKHFLVRELFRKMGDGFRVLDKITLIYDPIDRFEVFTSIYLSRNTDYYKNTVRWVKEWFRRGCPGRKDCDTISSSYQFREFLGIADKAYSIMNRRLEPIREVLELVRLHGVGVKSINAYLLHVYGITSYAPIDRYYREVLEIIGSKQVIPSKDICLRTGFDCIKCSYRTRCLYWITRIIFGDYNGIIQSIIYIGKRIEKMLKTRRISDLENQLLTGRDLDAIIDEANVFIKKIQEWIREKLVDTV
jgi:hypothetical protein